MSIGSPPPDHCLPELKTETSYRELAPVGTVMVDSAWHAAPRSTGVLAYLQEGQAAGSGIRSKKVIFEVALVSGTSKATGSQSLYR